MFRSFALCALALALAGCAASGLSQAECRTADWRAIGYEDGSQGKSTAELGEHRQDCAEHGVTPNFEAYMDGHGSGVALFCRPQNGFELGARGHRYGGVCPAGLEQAFLSAHADGLGLHQRRRTVDQLDKQITRKHRRSQKTEKLMAEKTAALVSPQTPAPQRLTIGVELKQLTQERVELERSISQLEVDLDHAEQDYQDYRESLERR